MASYARLLREYLIGTTVVTDSNLSPLQAWPIYLGERPDGAGVPHTLIAIRDTRGKQDGKIQRTGDSVTHPGIQISGRGLNYDEVCSKLQHINWWLDRINRTVVTFNSFDYVVSSCNFAEPIYIGQDRETNRVRHLFVLNGLMTMV